MKKHILSLVTLFTIVLLSQNLHAEENLVTKGAKIFNDNCTRCHNARPAQEFDEREWSVIIPHMREKAHMSGTEARAVEAFIAVTFTADKSGTEVASSPDETGEDLISKFACSGCHKINGQGGTVGPDLGGIVQRLGKDTVHRKILEPSFNNSASAMPKFPLNSEQSTKIVEVLSGQ